MNRERTDQTGLITCGIDWSIESADLPGIHVLRNGATISED